MLKMEMKTKVPILLFILLLLLTFAIVVKQRNSVTNDELNRGENTAEIEKSDDGENGVTFSAVILADNESNLTIKAKIDTHSGDLSEIDFKRDVVLEKNGKTYSAINATLGGAGHHLEANWSFIKVATPFVLVAKNIREIPRRELVF